MRPRKLAIGAGFRPIALIINLGGKTRPYNAGRIIFSAMIRRLSGSLSKINEDSYFRFLIFLACAVFLTACPQQTSINQVNGDPARYRGKEILIVWTVTNSFGALGQGAYELNDDTGKIWVLTRRGAPSKGARVGAVGNITASFGVGAISAALWRRLKDFDSRTPDS